MAFCNLDIAHDAVLGDFDAQYDSSFDAGLTGSSRVTLFGFDFSNDDGKNGIFAASCGIALPGLGAGCAAGGGLCA